MAMILLATFLGTVRLGAAPAQAPPPPPPTLPLLPTLPRVTIETGREYVTALFDLNLPRGDWQSGDLDLFVAFGAPGAPRALDARLFAVQPSAGDPAPTDVGEPIVVEPRSRRPAHAYALLGRSQMAGVVLRLRESAFRRATAAGSTARVRLRELLDLPSEDARTGREIVVRLGSEGGAPLALDQIVLRSLDPGPRVERAQARLCGPDSDTHPVALSILPRPPASSGGSSRAVAPSLAVRHLSDDLCVRFWTAS
jgi:hypothetical protein